MRWLGMVAGACAWFATLPAAAQDRPAGTVPIYPKVAVHFDVDRPGVHLFEIDPSRAPGDRIQPLCGCPCTVHVTPRQRLYFYDGDGIAKSAQFLIPQATPFVTLHAETKTLAMRGAGIGATIVGGLSMVAGGVLWGEGLLEENSSPSLGRKELVGGLAMIPAGGLVMGAGFLLLYIGKSSVRIEPGGAPAALLRLGPGGPALVF